MDGLLMHKMPKSGPYLKTEKVHENFCISPLEFFKQERGVHQSRAAAVDYGKEVDYLLKRRRYVAIHHGCHV